MSTAAIVRLAAAFSLDPRRIARRDAFDAAITDAVAVVGSVEAVVDEVLAGGPLRDVRWPWAVVLARLRALPEAYARREAAP